MLSGTGFIHADGRGRGDRRFSRPQALHGVVVILEAFSQALKQQDPAPHKPEDVLHCWLADILDFPPQDTVSQVIHTEITRVQVNGQRWFSGRSHTGEQLLKALYTYCRSYDNWRFARWLHDIRASDFGR